MYLISWIQIIYKTGRRECVGSSYTVHLQRAAGLFDILANICNHGGAIICWQILQGNCLSFSKLSKSVDLLPRYFSVWIKIKLHYLTKLYRM